MESRSRAAFHAAFRVGEWTVRPSCCRIEREGIQRHLRPMLMDILILLSEHAGTVVSKDQILTRVWDNRSVSESTLSRDIAVLRRLLGDDARRPSYIETISKRGLRLVAPVTALATRVQPRIAVLPFENLNRDAANEYLADGFTDALITELSRLPQMLVISRQSMLRFRGSPRAIPEIAAELRATALVEGSLVRVGDRIRVSAQLLDGPSDEHLWADTYEAAYAVPLSSLCRVAAEFARSIHSILVPEVVVPPSPAREIIDAAHIEYLKYRYHFAKWTEEGLHKSLAYLHHALEIDPTYAQAYGGLAWSLAILGYWGFMPIEEAYPRAKAAAMQAISLDPCSEAHTALALVKWFHDWDLAGTRSELRRAIETNPSNESAHILRGLFLAAIERDHDGAVEEAKRALDLDPLSPMSNFSAAWLLVFAGELEQGADRARRTLLLYPDSPPAMYALGWAQIGLGRISEAGATFERAATVAPGWTTQTYLAFAYGRSGRRNEALRLLRRLTAGAGDRLPDFAQALIHIGLGDCDRALNCLERTLAERDSRIFPFAVLPGLDALRADPRFGDLMHRVAAACQN